ncbi:Signal transduction histidine-protein kinase/phosphatase MprB [Vibrio aerogenes CECT 7868]|uniref:histidine kinase n=1 Tax=Vibrio aerogenes CECT 7868 TaxID=1216006 RepID=A0A1M6C9G9_9VIBR|nr:HAMP domain-containing sensor histidine kinase [Vibrio aerogenes]SHI57672.1 Signal transduction histidine-protein kinase/phosphatase MprB [Vibrio aerogenes CECT 7868]
MKIRRSLKIYFLLGVSSIGMLIVLGLSTLSAVYLTKGADIAMRYNMLEVVKNVELVGDKPKTMLGFTITRHWKDVPEIVRKYVPELKSHLDYGRHFEKVSFFDVPDFAVFALRYDRSPDDVIYICRIAKEIEPLDYNRNMPIPMPYLKLFAFAVVAIMTFVVMTLLLFRHIAVPVEKLITWARNLHSDDLHQPMPDFQYNELNNLANIIRTSLQSVQSSLEREKAFLSHASHELRTPISVVRSNSELMRKLIERGDKTQEKQQEVLCRILRASHTMTELCETLLWLNRGELGNLVKEDVELGPMLKQLIHELNDLVRDKEIEISVETDTEVLMLPATLVRIVLGNLIRNAFQHTYHGKVEIIQSGYRVKIKNFNYTDGNETNLGFGLGLKLTRQVIEHYQWPYLTNKLETGREVLIEFRTCSDKKAHA